MPDNKLNMEDLDYLAGLGFEQVPINESDLDELNKKVKDRTFSYNNGIYFGFISLIIGIFIGVSIFFMIDNKPVLYSSNFSNKVLNDTLPEIKNIQPETIVIDTVNVVKESFIQSHSVVDHVIDNNGNTYYNAIDSVVMIPSRSIDVSGMLDKKMSESRIKYIANAPIVYIHDLKVTNYTLLYFKKNQYVKLPLKGALSVAYANKEDLNKNRMAVKQGADYYLHEEFANALLAFKKADYGQAIYSLNIISSYNNNDINCNFYLGMSYYYIKNYDKAIELLEKGIADQNNSFLQEAMYYNALALYEMGEKEKALEKFKLIADEGEFYSEKAKGFLKN
jgi:hypothetical protein